MLAFTTTAGELLTPILSTQPSSSQAILPHLLNHTDLLCIQDSVSFDIVSWSMFPTLRKGDRIHLMEPGILRPGDMIVYHQADLLVCHRIVRLESRNLIVVKGDHSTGAGEFIHSERVLGKVSLIVRGSKQFSPGTPFSATWLDRVHKGIQQGRERGEEYVRQGILRLVQLLGRGEFFRRWEKCLLGRFLHFLVGVPMPVRLVKGYQFFDVGRSPLSNDSFANLPAWVRGASEPILDIYLGSRSIGTFHIESDKQELRQLGLHLPIQDHIDQAVHQFREWQRPSS